MLWIRPRRVLAPAKELSVAQVMGWLKHIVAGMVDQGTEHTSRPKSDERANDAPITEAAEERLAQSQCVNEGHHVIG